LPELAACRRWLLSEIALQGEGASPAPWKLPEDLEPRGAALTLSKDEQRALQQTGTATVVADATHRIIFATDSAGVLLGWPAAALVGQRISVIVPVDQREAHLAGFARYAITKQPRLIGHTVLVPALRHDGSVIELALTLRKIAFAAGDAFAAELEEPSTS
jgi:PAS domain S-box-containing protein